MSWYDTNTFRNNFGSSSGANGGGHRNTMRPLSGDNTIFDPFPPSQRQYAWDSVGDDIRPEPEPELESGTERGEDESEQALSRTQDLQPPRGHIRSTIAQYSPAVLLGKRKATRESHIASSSTSKASNEDALRQKRRKLLEMDDWTGVKALAALKPLKFQFPQYNKEAPVWGWGEAEAGPVCRPSPPRHPHESQRPPSSDTFSVKGYSLQHAPVERNSGHSNHSRTGICGHEHASSRRSSELQPATHLDKGKGRCPPVSPVAVSRKGMAAPARSKPSGSVRSGQSPYGSPYGSQYGLLPASSSTFGYERLSALDHITPDYHHPRSPSRLLSSVYCSVSQRPGSQTSPYFIEETPSTLRVPSMPSNSNIITTPSFTSTGRQSVISGTLSEEEQQRFESDGLAILSPSVPVMSAPALSNPSTSASLTPARQSSQLSSQQTPEIQQAPGSRQPSPDAPDEATEEGAADQETFDQETFDQGDVEREPTPKDFPLQPDTVQLIVKDGDIGRESPQVESHMVEPKEDVTSRVDDRLEARDHEDGLFEANRVNIRAIPDWNDGEDAIEDSDESEREAVRRMSKRRRLQNSIFGGSKKAEKGMFALI